MNTPRLRIGPIAVTVLVVAVNAAAWVLLGTDVAYCVADGRDVLLGRYTVGHFSALMVLLLLSVPALVLVWTRSGRRRRRFVQLLVLTVSVLLTVIVFDLVLRRVTSGPYVAEGEVEHRRPDAVFTGVTRDVPKTAFSYPAVKPGHPDVPYALTTDARGFRNASMAESCDVVVIGDSFAEGSEVSDNDAWPVLVARATGLRVVNLGMAGSGARQYRLVLERIALALAPRTVLLMLYEGNDFREDRRAAGANVGGTLRTWRKTSPVLAMLKGVMVRGLGPVGAVHMEDVPEDHPLWPVGWQPLAVPPGAGGPYYAFEWKRLASHWTAGDALRRSAGFTSAADRVAGMNALCREGGVRLVVIFAPDKPHVVLPLARKQLSPEQFRAFLALRLRDLPPAAECLDTLISRLDACEEAAADFCRTQSIPFLSLTAALREEVAAGRQAYFTYDQHWTPVGNRVVARVVADFLGGVDRP